MRPISLIATLVKKIQGIFIDIDIESYSFNIKYLLQQIQYY